MFKISRRMDYAVRIMIELGSVPSTERVMSETLSSQSGVPEAFLRKIIADLARSGLINTYAGPRGGIALSRLAEAITLLDIFEAIEGPVCLNPCILRPEECARSRTCASLGFWDQMQSMIVGELGRASLLSLVQESLARREKEDCTVNPRLTQITEEG